MENMLKLLLPLTVTLLLSITSAAADINCQACADTTCSRTHSYFCGNSPFPRCMVIKYQVTTRDKTTTHIVKNCDQHKLCSKDGSQTFSLTTKCSSVLAQVTCCSSEDCNDKFPTIPPVSSGTQQCSNHDPGDDKCSCAITCNSLETKCFSAKVSDSDITRHGCASANTCDSDYMSYQLFHKATGERLDGSLACTTTPLSPPSPSSLQCDMSLDTGHSLTLSVTAPSDMMCVAATVKVISGESSSVLELKGIAGAPLCSIEGSKAYSQDSTQDSGSTIFIQVRCCNSHYCNRDTTEVEFSDSVQSCAASTDCSAALVQQLTQLANGNKILPPA